MQRQRQHPWRRRVAAAGAGLLLAMIMAGCSGGGSTSESTVPPGTVVDRPQPSSTRYQGSGAPTGKERTRMIGRTWRRPARRDPGPARK